jgi:hypothetical protein
MAKLSRNQRLMLAEKEEEARKEVWRLSNGDLVSMTGEYLCGPALKGLLSPLCPPAEATEVIVVGNARFKRDLSDVIDKHRFVVRLNVGPVRGILNVGQRTSLRIVNSDVSTYHNLRSNALDVDDAPAWIWIPPRIWQKRVQISEFTPTSDTIVHESPPNDRVFSSADVAKIMRIVKTHYRGVRYPSLGLVSILMFLFVFNVPRVSVTGFDFFRSAHYYDDTAMHSGHHAEAERQAIANLVKMKRVRFIPCDNTDGLGSAGKHVEQPLMPPAHLELGPL